MDKLEDLLKIEDAARRQDALLGLARAGRVNTAPAKKADGRWDEDILTVLLYDALQKRQSHRRQNLGLVVGAVFITLMMVAAIMLMVRLLAAQ